MSIPGGLLPDPHSPMATRSKSSQRWLKEHFSDPYVKKAQAEGMRSRAVYKLEELLEEIMRDTEKLKKIGGDRAKKGA